MDYTKSKELQEKAHELIPGGCHAYAKGDDQYPIQAPGFIERGEGSHVFDVDGNEFIEYGMGLRSVTLGHGYQRVADAAYRASLNGTNFIRPTPIEIELAEEMLSLYPHGEMIKFGKNGSDVTDAAVKLSRAYTGRSKIAVPSNQPFFSVSDWFIGTTPMSAGIPEQIQELTVQFKYNDIDSVINLFDKHPGEIACLIMEPAKYEDPSDSFLHKTKEICHDNGAIFILDEMITGFRWDLQGAQKYYNIEADLCTFGKAMANGFSISALIGKKELMEPGGLHHDKERVFLLSLTHGSETSSMAAALETIKVYKEEDVVGRMWDIGKKLKEDVSKVVRELGLEDYVPIIGKPPCLVFGTNDAEKKSSQPFRTLFMQETIKRGLLMPSLIVSYAHSEEDIKKTVEGIGEALLVYEKALNEGVDKYLKGRSVQPSIRKFC